MSAALDTRQGTEFRDDASREITPLSLWGGDTLIYKSIIALSALALPLIAGVNLYLRGTPSWPQLGVAGSVLLGSLLCHTLGKLGRRDVAAALLIGVIWFTATLYCFNSGYGMHSAAVFMYLPCLLYTTLFFGLAIASVELALTIAVLVLMYLSEERGHLGGAAAYVHTGINFNFLIGVILTSIGTLAVGAVFHSRVEREAGRVLAEAEQRRIAIGRAREAQAQLQTAHAKLQQLNDELAQRGQSRDREMSRLKRDIGLYHDAVSREFPASLRALRQAIASPDEQTEQQLQREFRRMETVAGALADLGRQGKAAMARAAVSLSVLAEEEALRLREERAFAHVRFDIAGGLNVHGDPRQLAELMRHLVGRAARACRAESAPEVSFGSGSLDGRAVLFVRDNGPAMDAARRDRLFRPFERDKARPGAQDDSVEIAIVCAQHIVERHGGELIVDSHPGRGTTVYVSLPA